MSDRRALLLAGAAAALSACAPKAKPRDPLRFSILSTETSSAQGVKWAPFLKDLGEALGREVKPYFASAYAPLIEAMRFRQTDAGWFSNQSGLEAVRRGGGEVFAKTTHPDGARGYHSVIVVRKGRGLTLGQLLACDRKLSFGMGDAKSTSGTLAPRAWLFQPRDIDPATCFREVRSASHESNLLSVANGVLDAATNNTNDLERLRRRRNDPAAAAALSKLEVVWTSPALPEDPMIVRRDLDPALKAQLRAAVLAYGGEPGAEGERRRHVLTDLNFGRFDPASDRHLLTVRELEASDLLATARKKGDAVGADAEAKELAAIRADLAKGGA